MVFYMTIINQIKKFIENIKNSANVESEVEIIVTEKEISSGNSDSELSRAENEFKYYAYFDTDQMQEMIKSLEEIKKTNETVYKLITIIANLTSQTNLLAVNTIAEAAEMSGNIDKIGKIDKIDKEMILSLFKAH